MLIKDSLKSLSDDDPALTHAKLSSSALKILHYIDAHGHIGLMQLEALLSQIREIGCRKFQLASLYPVVGWMRQVSGPDV